METNKNYYTTNEVVAITGASEGTVCVWRREKKIESIKNPENKKTLVFEAESFISFLAKKANKRYLDCATAKSNLFHSGDFNKLILRIQVEVPEEIKEPEVKKPPIKPISPVTTKADIKAFETHISDLDKASTRVDNSIKHLESLKISYTLEREQLKDSINDSNRFLNEARINKLNGAIRGVLNTIEVLKSIKRGYKNNAQALRSIIDINKNINQ